MDLFATLGVALGLAMLAGINLYLTIFITGLAVKLDWFANPAIATALEGFGHPAVIAVSLGLFVVQFIVDKVPWLDSLWDSIHTFLKPAGGVLLALTSLGPEAGTVSQVFVAMLALVGSLLSHGVKAGTRLTINTTPEPFSNIGASVAEDLLVIGGFALIANQPSTAFFVFALALALFVFLTPRVARAIRAILWLIWKKLRVPADNKSAKRKDLPHKLSADAEVMLLDEFGSEKYNVAWCLPCVCGKTRNAGKLCRNLFGDLISIRERPGKLFFFGSRNFKKFVETIELGGALATHESHFISEGIVVHNKRSKFHAELRFHRGQVEIAERITDFLQGQIATEDLSEPEQGPGAVEKTEENPVPPPASAPAEEEDKDDGKDEEEADDSTAPSTGLPALSRLSPLGAVPEGDEPENKTDDDDFGAPKKSDDDVD